MKSVGKKINPYYIPDFVRCILMMHMLQTSENNNAYVSSKEYRGLKTFKTNVNNKIHMEINFFKFLKRLQFENPL